MRPLNPINMLFIEMGYDGDERTEKVIEGINKKFDRRLKS